MEKKNSNPYQYAKLVALLNHTSLFEPLYLQGLSFSYLWYIAHHAIVPGADITLNRPLVGRFWKLMLPQIASVSRKQDETWENYLRQIGPDSLILIAPEGRMKRENGLDKFGKKMTIKPGIVDCIEALSEGSMILAFSAGLHHVQKPGQKLPKIFKTIKMHLYEIDLTEYKSQFNHLSMRERKVKITADLQARLEKDCPQL